MLPPADENPFAPPGDAETPTLAGTLGVTDRPERWCPVDRLPQRRRNQICIWVIAAGLANFVAYTLGYAVLGGDAPNGYRAMEADAAGRPVARYYVRGHFIHSLSGRAGEVSRGAWIYSYLHSLSVPLTSGAMLISMLVLARPHILATMRGGLVSGQTFVVAFGTVVVLITVGVTALFAAAFVRNLSTG
ncbi:MAG: hypothetical protein AB1716_11445 [Planctomycetota bacterium]